MRNLAKPHFVCHVLLVFQVQSSTKILIKLIKKMTITAQWAPEPGPLKLVAIDTGGGKMLLRQDVSDDDNGR